jgi:GntR family transcriptional regulator
MSEEISANNPLYIELADRLRADIESGVFGPGDRMPSEPSLCRTTGHSRSTVRKALQLLVDQGYVTKSQGKGTFVSELPQRVEAASKMTPTFLSFTENALSLGATPTTRTIDLRNTTPTPGLAEFFGVAETDELFEVTRLRSVNGEPVMLETIWLPLAYSDLTGDELDGSLYKALKARYGKEPSTGTKSIGICYANSRESFQLGVERDSPLMLIEDHVVDQDGAPLHVSKQVLRGDKHQYSMSMPRVES